jgi:alpha-L-fucosidase 2
VDYKRGLDLHTGIVFAEFNVGANHIREEVFASAPADLIILTVRASKPFSADINLTRKKDAIISYDEGGWIRMQGQIVDENDSLSGPGGNHMRFAALCKVEATDGKVRKGPTSIALQGVRNITIYITASTDYVMESLNTDQAIDPLAVCEKIMKKSRASDLKQIVKNHLDDYTTMFDRVVLHFGKDTLSGLPTDVRLKRVKEGAVDNALTALYFQYGRYLLMGSSRKPGRLPANLQGIWNDKFKAPWNADFHTNINLQMNYWPAEVCNLPECTPVLTDFIKALTVPGSVTAKAMYGQMVGPCII